MTNKLKNALEVMLISSQYEHRYGNHIEDRESMVNFSVVGRNCTQEQREEYYEWDKVNEERKHIVNLLKSKYNNLDLAISGLSVRNARYGLKSSETSFLPSVKASAELNLKAEELEKELDE